MQLTISISEARASADPQAVLVTYSLGSCVGMTMYDPQARVGGILHCQLPTSTLDAQKAAKCPAMFADTGFKYLLDEMLKLGASKKRVRVRIAGAAQMLNDAGVFDIGRRNHAAIRKILWQQGMFLESEHVGGSVPRTLYLSVADGAVMIKAGTETIRL